MLGVWNTGFRRSVWMPVAALFDRWSFVTLRPEIAGGGFCHSPPLRPVWMVDAGDGLQEPLPLFGRQSIQHSAIGGYRFEQFGCITQAVENLG